MLGPAQRVKIRISSRVNNMNKLYGVISTKLERITMVRLFTTNVPVFVDQAGKFYRY